MAGTPQGCRPLFISHDIQPWREDQRPSDPDNYLINLDPDCEPLLEFLGDMPRQFEKWPLEKRFKQVHVAKVLRCNWKVAQEAFMESWHVVATHSQLLPGIGDIVATYDTFGNFSRAITPNAVPSPHLNWQPTEQEMFDALTDRNLDEQVNEIPADISAREHIANNRRNHLQHELGEAAQELSDAEMLDSMVYTLFPNLHPWGSYNRTLYRFRPYGNDPSMCIMECMILSPYEGDERPHGAPPPISLRLREPVLRLPLTYE